MSLVPSNEVLQAEVWLKNEDAGFVRRGQEVKVKLAAYPFQKYGMLDGKVLQISADSTERNLNGNSRSEVEDPISKAQFSYRTLIQLQHQNLRIDKAALQLSPGMQVAAEIKLADQTVMEYLLSPVRRAFHDAGRER
jgi:HlyD family secretion protein